MKILKINIRNFRRLENVSIDMEKKETVFVGPNNSGKTSATAIFRCFLGGREFRIHDFSVQKISDINSYGDNEDTTLLSSIELDIWFSIDPNSIDFGRAFTLLPRLSDELDRLGIRMRFGPTDAVKMRTDYVTAYPPQEDGKRSKTLSQFLGMDSNLKRHFEISYLSLEDKGEEILATPLERQEGKSLLQSLVKVDFVDAQRNIDDDETRHSNRLSDALATFYRKNLDQPEAAIAAHRIIDENNERLTAHYAEQFGGLMSMISGLGVPSINDRALKIVSSLSPETALKGNTELLYVDASLDHELPELYNGLGFKNLIYMAIQVKHFHSQWLLISESRPLCQIIFIEEPEVHLHAQVQQTFIANIWQVISTSGKEIGDEALTPQLVVTTHSSHVLETIDFSKVRYFRRCPLSGEDPATAKILNASQVHSLRNFQPDRIENDGQEITEDEALQFLKRYLKLTHCDLFFADAVILVEGSVEKLLLPSMIEKVASRLSSTYLTTLEVGGAYAYRFEGLLAFLEIPYLIVTDLDSVEPAGHHRTCRADTLDAWTSNTTLKRLLEVTTIAELTTLSTDQKQDTNKKRYITFQTNVSVEDDEAQQIMLPRTIEEAFVYQNFGMFRNGELQIGVPIPRQLNDVYETVYKRIRSSEFKKTDFAMDVLASPDNWETPNYIEEGLKWLELRLLGPEPTEVDIEK